MTSTSVGLARVFARRMLPLAIIAGAVVAAVPPLTYRVLSWRSLSRQGQTYAGHVATRLHALALRQPRLWRYNAAKVLQATVPHRGQPDIAAIEIVDCAGKPVFSSLAFGLGSGVAGPSGAARVELHGREVARVVVRMDPARPWRMLGLLALLCAPLGLVIGALLFAVPLGTVRRQGRRLAAVLDDLTRARGQLEDSNAELVARVDQAVGRVRQLSAQLVGTQEEERRRIARDLHDGLGQAITGMQMELELLRARPEEHDQRLARVIDQLRETLAELRRVVRELRPPELEADDLPAALRATAEVFEQRSGITTYFRCEGEAALEQLGEPIAICLLRVLQQALTNVRQHAEASEVAVRLSANDATLSDKAPVSDEATSSDDATITLEVSDDGRGFEPERVAAGRGSGLRGMRERLELLGGTFELISSPGAGTRLTARMPSKEP
jgi:two-component system NarL family sensor kinase